MMNDAIAKVTEIAGQLEEKGEIYMTKKARKRFLSTAGPILLESGRRRDGRDVTRDARAFFVFVSRLA